MAGRDGRDPARARPGGRDRPAARRAPGRPERDPGDWPPKLGGTAGANLRALYAASFRQAWAALLELVVLAMAWSLCLFIGGAALVGTLSHGGGLIALYLLPPLVLWAPATVGLHAAVDAIWSGESLGPFDALRAFGGGFRRRYLRSVGLGAIWVVVFVGTYANVLLSPHILPAWLLGAAKVLLLYLVLFFFMVHVYLMPILARTGFALVQALRVAAWEVLANPLFTLGCLVVPALVLLGGLAITPVVPVMLLGGAIGLFATAGLRFVPLRHPDLPPPVWLQAPADEGPGTRQGSAPGPDAPRGVLDVPYREHPADPAGGEGPGAEARSPGRGGTPGGDGGR